jgi:Ca2+-binding EF-hand superfamily protein
LTFFGLKFSEEDLPYLSDRYKEIRDHAVFTRWRDFCDEVERMAESRTTLPLVADSSDVTVILDKVRRAIVRLRINVLPTLQGFDRQKRGFITAPQFHRALSTLQILVSVPELSVLAAAYGHGDDEIDYFKFVEDVDPAHTQRRRSFRPIGTTVQSIDDGYGRSPSGDRFVTQKVADSLIHQSKRGLIPKVDEHRDIKSLLQAMKRSSIVNSIMFHDFLQDFDRHKCGEIHVSQFRSEMSMSTYKLTDVEYEVILVHYQSDSRPEFVKWKQFADDILAAVAPIELERTPQVAPQHSRTFVRNATEAPAVEGMPASVSQVIDIVARFVKTRRVSLMEQFKEKDPMNHRKVISISFAQIIQLLGVHICKQEVDLLCTYYNDPTTNFVEYPMFVDEVNSRAGQIFGDRASQLIVVNPIPK